MTKLKKRNILLIISLLGLATLYVAANMLASQAISPLFFKITNENDTQSAVTFLQAIKHEPQYNVQLEYFKEKFGTNFENELQKNSLLREKEIQRLKNLLSYNPQSRDLLIELAILYYYQNDKAEAKQYYQKAKVVDPAVKIKELENIKR